MSLYLTRFSYTPETWARLTTNPEDRREAARAYIESVGGKLHGFWYAFGEYDAYNLWEAPDNVSMAAVAIAISGGGALSKFATTPLLTVEETLDALDGLILSGGADLDPVSYGEEAHAKTSSQLGRDRAELALLEAALARELPVLAICRGMQLLNVLHHGNLHQHLPEVVGHEGHRETSGAFSEHGVTLQPGSKAASVLGERAQVKSTHHQAPDRIGVGLAPVAWAEDGTVEAVEDPERAFAIGVLWHPEEGGDKRLFESLVDEARRYRVARSRGTSA
jgi:putative glutamine amidotransferase